MDLSVDGHIIHIESCSVRWMNTKRKIRRWARRSNGVAAERFRGRPRPLERPRGWRCVFSQILETIDFRSSRHSIFRPYRAHDRGRRLLKRSAVVCVYSGNLNNGISTRFFVTSDTTRRGGKFFSSYRIILHADAYIHAGLVVRKYTLQEWSRAGARAHVAINTYVRSNWETAQLLSRGQDAPYRGDL